ncbi:hypothetical protein GGR53DRAFT_464448 [Hypoxylon sp. FL1150]|nr:hypothetical protein GGR53DRAFT_464448 [Hypoxylon sp. FL1150]
MASGIWCSPVWKWIFSTLEASGEVPMPFQCVLYECAAWELLEEVWLWIEGAGIARVLLVKLTETPSYRTPVKLDGQDDGDTAMPGIELPPGEQLGLVTYRGHSWFGQITEVFMETWILDKKGKAVQATYEGRKDLLSGTHVDISFGDILPPGYFQTITLDSNYILHRMTAEIIFQARWRYKELMRGQNPR